MRCGLTYHEQLEEWTRTREALGRYDDEIASFTVRYTELSDWHLQPKWEWDLDISMSDRPVEDWFVAIPDKSTLVKFLALRLSDLNELRTPAEVDYPDPPTNDTRWIALSEIERAV
jgi:hypothetical protein